MVQVYANCIHRHYLNNDVHSLILQNSSTGAVDDALNQLTTILGEQSPDETLLLLIDARAGIPPITYFFTELRKVYSKQDVLPQIRAAYIYEDSLVLTAIQAFFNTFRMNASRRFIKGGTELEAIEWLTSDQK